MKNRHAALLMMVAGLAANCLGQADYLSAAELSGAGLSKYWQVDLRLPAGEEVVSAYLVDDQVYVGTAGGYCYAIHADTGAVRWLQQVTRLGYVVRRPCHAGDRTIFATATDIQVYDRRTGEGLRRIELEFPCGSAPATDGQRVFVGGLDGRFYAFRLDTGFVDWRFITRASITNAPAVYEDKVYFAADTGGVFAATTRDKRPGFSTRTFGNISGDLVINDDGVFVASRDQTLYLFDLLVGAVRWRGRFSGPLYEAPVVTADLAFQYCPDDGLVAVETGLVNIDNRLRWTLPRGRMALTTDDTQAYVLMRDGVVEAVDLATGAARHTIAANSFDLPIPAPLRGMVLLADRAGRVFCARAKGVPFPRAEDVRLALAPPEARAAREAAVAAPPAPTPKPPEDPLATERRGAPLGGKSKISRNWGAGEPR